MKKITLTLASTFMLLLAHAQQVGPRADIRQKMEELNAITDESLLNKRLHKLSKSKVEEEQNLAYYYLSSKKDEIQAEKLKENIKKKFPTGQLAFQDKANIVTAIKDLQEREQAFVALQKDYPNQSYNRIAESLARDFALQGNEEKMVQYVALYGQGVNDGRGNRIPEGRLYGQFARYMMESNPDAAAKYLKLAVDEAKKSVDERSANTTSDTNLLERANGNYLSILTTYLHALTAGSDPSKAYALAKDLYDNAKEDSRLSERMRQSIESTYAMTLIATDRLKEVLPLIENAVRAGSPDLKLVNNLKKAYVATHGSASGYDLYYNRLLEDQVSKMQEEVVKMAINQPSHDFELKDVDGKTVKLSDLRGKVVVLDFWATWCGPCKASFPAMQKAVNQYKDDKNVQFLFLHTWEKGGADAATANAGAKSYVDDNKYTFDVLMDLRNPTTNESAVAKAYQVKGIPTKIIIDPKGQIRFNTSGFSADETKAVKELSAMIEFARKI